MEENKTSISMIKHCIKTQKANNQIKSPFGNLMDTNRNVQCN